MKATYLLSALLALPTLVLSAQEIHVSVNGNDANSGTSAKPVASLTVARDRLRNLKTTGTGLRPTIYIHRGTYELNESLVFDERNSGSEELPLTVMAAPGEKVTISGGRSLNGKNFRAVKDKKILARLPEIARRSVVQINLRSAGINSYGEHQQYGHALPVIPSTIELFFNSEPMTLARYPNKGAMKIGKVADKGSVPRNGDRSNRGAIFAYTDDHHKKWAEIKDVWIQGTLNYGFADDFNSIENIDTVKGLVKLAKPHLYGVASGQDFQEYVAMNILEELDQPGEWYVDRATGILYFWPPAPIENSSIVVSMLQDPIISLEGVKHFQIKNLLIEAGRGIGIYIERSHHTLIAGCTVTNMGTSGIFMGQGARNLDPASSIDDYQGEPMSRQVGSYQNLMYTNTAWNRNAGTHNVVQSCDIYNTGSGGISLSGGDKKRLTPGNSAVINCRIYNYTRRNKFTWAGIRVDGCGNLVSHNEIFNSDWHGIFVQGNEHVFEYNHIHDVTLNSNDTSPWYMGRNPSDRGNIVRYNFFDHCGNKNRMNMGIYCDDSSTGVTIYGNVFNDMMTNHGVLFSNTGWDLVMKNNIIINPGAHTVVNSAHYYSWASAQAKDMFGVDGLLRKRLEQAVNFREPPYSEKYPTLLPYLDVLVDNKEWQGMRARGNVLEQNLIVGGPEDPIHLMGKYAQTEGKNNWVTKEDPGFEDMKNKNFNLKPDAKVFRMIPGFQTLPFDKMGTYTDEYRKK